MNVIHSNNVHVTILAILKFQPSSSTYCTCKQTEQQKISTIKKMGKTAIATKTPKNGQRGIDSKSRYFLFWCLEEMKAN